MGQRQSSEVSAAARWHAFLNAPLPETLEDFYQYVGWLREVWPEWRAGQTWFNALYHVKPELAARISNTTGLDPFQDSRKITALDSWLRMNWNA